MRFRRAGKIIALLLLGGGLVWLSDFLLRPGWGLGLTLFVRFSALLLALPENLWWWLGLSALLFWSLRLAFRLAGEIRNRSKRTPTPEVAAGRLSELRNLLQVSSLSPFYHDSLRHVFQSLAIDLIALRSSLTEEAARKRFYLSDWTQDEALRTYLLKSPEDRQPKASVRSRFRRSRRHLLVRETEEMLARLIDFGGPGERG